MPKQCSAAAEIVEMVRNTQKTVKMMMMRVQYFTTYTKLQLPGIFQDKCIQVVGIGESCMDVTQLSQIPTTEFSEKNLFFHKNIKGHTNIQKLKTTKQHNINKLCSQDRRI